MGKSPMTPHQVQTAWLMLALVLLAIAADVGLILWRGQETSISLTLRAAAEHWGALPWVASFAAGALVSHWFW